LTPGSIIVLGGAVVFAAMAFWPAASDKPIGVEVTSRAASLILAAYLAVGALVHGRPAWLDPMLLGLGGVVLAAHIGFRLRARRTRAAAQE
jgi:hypothetical protein